jgi:hypothetical protein
MSISSLICKMFGHQPEDGRLQRSPYTVHTHWRDRHCKRCGEKLGSEKMYIDANLRADLFQQCERQSAS